MRWFLWTLIAWDVITIVLAASQVGKRGPRLPGRCAMNVDVAVASGAVWLAAHGIQVMAVGLVLLVVAAAFLWSPRRQQDKTIADLRADLAAARLVIAQERHNGDVAMRLANQAIADRACTAADLQELKALVQTATDRIACVEMELRTEWEGSR